MDAQIIEKGYEPIWKWSEETDRQFDLVRWMIENHGGKLMVFMK